MTSILDEFEFCDKIPKTIKSEIKYFHVFNGLSDKNVIFITKEDNAYALGDNSYGVLGLGHDILVEECTEIKVLSKQCITNFYIGWRHIWALNNINVLYGWGWNNYGQLGRAYKSDQDESLVPEKLEYFKNESIEDICCGCDHTLVLLSNRVLYGWGRNSEGQLGLDDQILIDRPSKLRITAENDLKIKYIFCHKWSSFAITTNGELYFWGNKIAGSIMKNCISKEINLFNVIKASANERSIYFLTNEGSIYFNDTSEQDKLKKIDEPEQEYLNMFSTCEGTDNIHCMDKDMRMCKIKNNDTFEILATSFKSFTELYAHVQKITPKTVQISSDGGIIDSNMYRNFKILSMMGSGGFGTVAKCINVLDKQLYAMKKIDISNIDINSDISLEFLLREVQTMAKLKSNFVVQYNNSWIENNCLYIQMEFCFHNLRHILSIKPKVFQRNPNQAMNSIEFFISLQIFCQITEALNYLHSLTPEPLIHRDLKPENILIGRSANRLICKIADFGLSKFIDDQSDYHTMVGATHQYRAPEISSAHRYDTKVDMWSLGIIALELFNLDFQDENQQTIKEIELIDDLISNKLLNARRHQRVSCSQLLLCINEFSLTLSSNDQAQLKYYKSRFTDWNLQYFLDIISDIQNVVQNPVNQDSLISNVNSVIKLTPEQKFKRIITNLQIELDEAKIMALEANMVADEMNKNIDYKMILQIPCSSLYLPIPDPILPEPAILVNSKYRSTQLWSMERFVNNLGDIRNIYQEWKQRQSNVKEQDYFDRSYDRFNIQENHDLIGVASIYLVALTHDVVIDYLAPIINQQGKVTGKLHVEFGRVGGSSIKATNKNKDSNSSKIDPIIVRVLLKKAYGLPQHLSNFVFSQFTIWGYPESIVMPSYEPKPEDHKNNNNYEMEEKSLNFNAHNDFQIAITQEFIDYCSEGVIPIEIWGHRMSSFSPPHTGWLDPDSNVKMLRLLSDRWNEMKRRIEVWVEIQELNEKGEYSVVEVLAKNYSSSGGVYRLRQGRQRRITVTVLSKQGSGSLPLFCESIKSIEVGCVCVRSSLQKPLDSYQEEDLTKLRQKWSETLNRRRQYLNDEIQRLADIRDKTNVETNREQSLINQLILLTEERNAVNLPPPGSDVPGAVYDWIPPPGMETNIPIVFLDINTNDMTLMRHFSEQEENIAGKESILPKEHNGTPFFTLPIIYIESGDVSAIAIWDTSLHDSVYLNRVTDQKELIYLILKVTIHLSHPLPIDVVLRKRLCINVYKEQSFTSRLLNKISRTNRLTATAVTYDIVSSIPKTCEDIENRESLALMAAADPNRIVTDGDTYLESYTKCLSALKSVLTLDRLRQEVAVKEMLKPLQPIEYYEYPVE